MKQWNDGLNWSLGDVTLSAVDQAARILGCSPLLLLAALCSRGLEELEDRCA